MTHEVRPQWVKFGLGIAARLAANPDELSKRALTAFFTLLAHTSYDGRIKVSQRRMAEYCKLRETHFSTAVKELVQFGVIRKRGRHFIWCSDIRVGKEQVVDISGAVKALIDAKQEN